MKLLYFYFVVVVGVFFLGDVVSLGLIGSFLCFGVNFFGFG